MMAKSLGETVPASTLWSVSTWRQQYLDPILSCANGIVQACRHVPQEEVVAAAGPGFYKFQGQLVVCYSYLQSDSWCKVHEGVPASP